MDACIHNGIGSSAPGKDSPALIARRALRPLPRSTFILLVWIICAAALHPLMAASLGVWPQVSVGKPAGVYINGIAYGNGLWVAVGEKGFIATSPDGVKWTKRSAGMKRDFNGVAFTGAGFVAVAKVTTIGAPEAKIFVADGSGSKWLPRDTDEGVNDFGEGLHGVAADGMGTVVAVGGAFGSRITVSHDYGNTWSAKNLAPFGGPWGKLYGVAYGSGKWMAVGSGTILISEDGGTTWSKQSSDSGRSVCYGNGRWLRVNDSANQLLWSPVDQLDWTAATIETEAGSTYFRWARGCAFFDGLFVGVGEYGDIWSSDNGRIFQLWEGASRENDGADMVCVAGGDRGFMAGGVDFVSKAVYGAAWSSPPWMRARLGSTWDFPYTVFDAEEAEPRKIGLPQYQVNTASLNLLLEGTLFYMQTLGAPVNLRLVFNSTPTPDGADTIGLFGKNWRMGYESMIGQFGQEARLITDGGRMLAYTTPGGQDLSTATLANPIILRPPDGIFDTLTFYGPGQYFELKKKGSKMVYRYGVSGGAGNSIWRLTRVTDRSGNHLTLTVDGTTGQISRITDPTDRQVNFTYDSEKNLCTSITVPDGRRISFSYDNAGHKNLERITDMAGHIADYKYDDFGFVTQMTVAGRTSRFSYAKRPGYEDQDSEQENAGDKVIASITDPSGGTTRYEFLDKGAGVRRTDRGGKVTTYTSSEGQTTRVVDPLGNIRALTFSRTKLPSAFTEPNGNVTHFTHDERGNLLTRTDALGNTTNYAYDGSDNLTSTTDPLGKTVAYAYDASSRLTSITTALPTTTLISYFGNGRIQTLKDARNNTSTFQYNSHGHLTRVTDPLGKYNSYTCDGTGRTTGCTDALGETKTFTYDANDRLTEVVHTSATGSPTLRNTFDAFGQTGVTDPMGRKITIQRNLFGFPTRVTDPLANALSTDYDPDNNPVATTDPLGRTTTTTYDSANRPLILTDPSGKKTTRSYDTNGNLTEFLDTKKNKTAFAYDKNNRLVSTTDPLGKKRTLTRDALGRITSTTNARGQEVAITYDADGRITDKTFKDSKGNESGPVAFTHDANANVTKMEDDWGTTNITYDANNRPLSITYPTEKSAGFTYNDAGLPATVSYPNGLVVTYTYDHFNRTGSSELPRSGSLLGNQEPGKRVASIQISKGAESKSIAYSYDAAAQPILTDRPDAAPDTNYTYDTAGRLSSLIHNGGGTDLISGQYTLDAAGNIVDEASTGDWLQEAPLPETSKMVIGKGNQITSRNGQACSHDADGNLISVAKGQFAATYNPENRPESITRMVNGTAETITYTYDGNGMRVKRAVTGGETVQFHYGPGGELLFTTDGAGNLLACYIWKGASLAAVLTGNSLSDDLVFPLLNHIGSVVALAGLDGAERARLGYQPFGVYEMPLGAANPGLFTFVGGLGVQDEGHGLFYMKNRFYDAHTGRFLQRDPLGLDGGINLYAYASANPNTFIDPYGLWSGKRAFAGVLNLGLGGLQATAGYLAVKTGVLAPKGVAHMGLGAARFFGGLRLAYKGVVGSPDDDTYSKTDMAKDIADPTGGGRAVAGYAVEKGSEAANYAAEKGIEAAKDLADSVEKTKEEFKEEATKAMDWRNWIDIPVP